MWIPDHLNCLLRNLYSGQEATVRTGHGTTDWFQIGKGVCQGYILSPCSFNLYAEYIMRNTRLDEAQGGIKIARRNISNLRFWCWEGLGAEGEGDNRGWDGWMVSPTRWTWIWVNSRIWWWTGMSGVLQFMGSQRVGHDWVTELNCCRWHYPYGRKRKRTKGALDESERGKWKSWLKAQHSEN